jgi:hypothetical protein
MADIEIKARISADTSEATKGVDKLNNSLNNSKQSTKDSAGLFGTLKETLGKVSPAADGAIGAFDGIGKSMWKLVANPVGAIILAIVAALALLYKSFTNSFEGGQKMEQIFAGIKAAGQALIDNLEKIGGAIVKLMHFDFSGAINDIKGVAKEAGAAYEAMSKLTKDAQKLHQEQLANDLDQAERAKKLAILREQATDETIPIAKRKAALQDLKRDAEQNSKDDIDLAKRTTDNKIAQLTLQKDGAKKNQDEINKLKIEQIKVETENAGELRRINKQLISIDKTAEAERKQIAAEAKARKEKELVDEKQYLQVKNRLSNEANLAAITDEVQLAKQKVINQENDKIKEVQALKTSEKNKAELIAMLRKSSLLEIEKIENNANEKKKKAQADFDAELNKLHIDTLLSGVKDARAKEQAALDLGFEEKFNQAAEKYKNDAVKLQQVQAELAVQQRNAQAALDEKFEKEDKEKKKIKDAEQADLQTSMLDPYAKELADLEASYKKKLEIAKGNNILINAVEKEFGDQKIALKEAHAMQELKVVGGMASKLAGLLGEQTAAGKAAAVAGATIDTYAAAWSAYRNAQKNPISIIGPAYPYIQAGLAVAAGFANIKKILSVPAPGGGGAAPSAGSIPSPITPQQQSTMLNSASIQGVGNAAGAGVGRSFVLDTDIKDNQERQARINRAARLG